mgnify:CR=1 FL=1
MKGRVWGCVFDDQHGLKSRDAVGLEHILFETDYPHTDTTWPNTLEVATAMMGHLPEDVQYKILRGNAIKMLHLDMK